MQADLLMICLTAFSAVFILLAILAGVMSLITLAFPRKAPVTDSVHIAAIASAMYSLVPGSKVTKIEEIS